jgi:putative FmdB family regulatory protein
MPLYDYECLECGKTFDKFKKVEDRFSVYCPNCGFSNCQLLISKVNCKVFHDYIEHNICEKPIHIKSTRHLRDELKRQEDKTKGMEKLIAI